MTLHDHAIDAARLDHRPDGTAGLAVIALLLALVLGLGAADRTVPPPAQDALSAKSPQQERAVLDGRGKWGGYLN